MTKKTARNKLLNSLILPSCLARLDNPNYLMPPHLKLLEKKVLECVTQGNKRLLINMPPRHGKSEYISKYFTSWFLINYPNKRVILTSYNASFASTWGRKCRSLIDTYGHLKGTALSSSSKAGHRFSMNGYNDSLTTAGAGGTMSGLGADILIIDDPVKNAADAHSQSLSGSSWDWFNSTAYTRIEPNGSIIIIQTRWTMNDLSGRILENDRDNWEVLTIKGIAEENDILGREEGEPLWADRYDINKLNEIKKQIGSYWFSALYQQTPIASEYQIIKPEWWRYYTELPKIEYKFQSWDTAFKNKQENDYSVCTTWGLGEKGFYLIDCWRHKVIYPDLERQVKLQYDKHKPNLVGIEDAASGQSLIQNLQRNTMLPIKAIPVSGKDKQVRANLCSPLFEIGRVFLPDNASFNADIVNECAEFPHSAHDDIVDSITQALSWLRNISSNSIYKTSNILTKENPFINY